MSYGETINLFLNINIEEISNNPMSKCSFFFVEEITFISFFTSLYSHCSIKLYQWPAINILLDILEIYDK